MENKKRIALATPRMMGNELKKVKEAFESNWIAPLGPFVNKFEEDFKQSYTSCKVCDFSGYDSLVNFKTVGGWKEICLMKQRIEIKKMGMVL